MLAQREVGEEAWRRRHIWEISVGGRARVFSTSMKEDRVLRAGGLNGEVVGGGGADGCGGGNDDDDTDGRSDILGAGGGCGYGDC